MPRPLSIVVSVFSRLLTLKRISVAVVQRVRDELSENRFLRRKRIRVSDVFEKML
jgi:hypothetical protein